jgi:ABC-type multidrug transport system ATPase subunit
MHDEFRGRAVYHAEINVHFPHLTVRQTLALAAKIRAPQRNTTDAYANRAVESVVTALHLSKALDTKVGSDFVQGASGGERQRTSIAVGLTRILNVHPSLKNLTGVACQQCVAAMLG